MVIVTSPGPVVFHWPSFGLFSCADPGSLPTVNPPSIQPVNMWPFTRSLFLLSGSDHSQRARSLRTSDAGAANDISRATRKARLRRQIVGTRMFPPPFEIRRDDIGVWVGKGFYRLSSILPAPPRRHLRSGRSRDGRSRQDRTRVVTRSRS